VGDRRLPFGSDHSGRGTDEVAPAEFRRRCTRQECRAKGRPCAAVRSRRGGPDLGPAAMTTWPVSGGRVPTVGKGVAVGRATTVPVAGRRPDEAWEEGSRLRLLAEAGRIAASHSASAWVTSASVRRRSCDGRPVRVALPALAGLGVGVGQTGRVPRPRPVLPRDQSAAIGRWSRGSRGRDAEQHVVARRRRTWRRSR